MSELLIEIGCEELPARSVLPLAKGLAAGLHTVLDKAGLASTPPTVYATPRRLAVLWRAVEASQAEQRVERRGPSVQAAYADGQPTRALQGFLKSANATAEQLTTVSTPKGDWLMLEQRLPGRALHAVLDEHLAEVVNALPMPRRMRWGDQLHEFLRPVSWLLALHGDRTLPLTLFGLQAGNTTRGHRFHAPGEHVIASAGVYVEVLEAARVVADVDERRGRVVDGVRREAQGLGGNPVMDAELIDEVTALVEWPVALAGRYDEEFLALPREALIQTMQENQRYFALADADGALMPAFITVANLESSHPATVIEGNERVIRPRFADTMFFWNLDRAQTLEARLPALDRLLFQEKLGSVGDKVARLATLAAFLAGPLDASADTCIQAANLCKCDLTTEIVKELPKMQGIAGRYYALREGLDPALALAIEEHYYPRHAGDRLPANGIAESLSLADKCDTLVGIFGLGMKPTGAKDPFGLRRAAIGIVRILIEGRHDLALDQMVAESLVLYGDDVASAHADDIVAFVIERLRRYMLDQGFTADTVDAVLARQSTRPLDIATRLEAIREFRGTDAAVALSAASKRIVNILKKAGAADTGGVDPEALEEPAETMLFEALQSRRPSIDAALKQRDYQQAMTLTASLREPVDGFFDGVMVLVDDAALRRNRLALLADVELLCSSTADLSRLQPQAS